MNEMPPKSISLGSCGTVIFIILDSAPRTPFQYPDSFEQDQNMWTSEPTSTLHLVIYPMHPLWGKINYMQKVELS